MRRAIRVVVFVVIVSAITYVGVRFWKSNPFDFEGCSATVDSTTASLSTGQGEVAALVAAIGVQRGLPARAVSIALAAGYQESKLNNLPAGDRDSIGIFQQRPSQGWGTAAQIMDPVYSINAFYNALLKVDGYETMPITVAAQTVQHSGYPDAYARHANEARALSSALSGFTPSFSCVVNTSTVQGTATDTIAALRRGYGNSLSMTQGVRQDVVVTVPAGDTGQRAGWSVAQYAIAYAKTLHIHSVTFDGKTWTYGHPSAKGWRASPNTDATKVTISMG